jgi:hypothetical protein
VCKTGDLGVPTPRPPVEEAIRRSSNSSAYFWLFLLHGMCIAFTRWLRGRVWLVYSQSIVNTPSPRRKSKEIGLFCNIRESGDREEK